MIILLFGILLLVVWIASSPFYWKLRRVPSRLPIPVFGNTIGLITTFSIKSFGDLYTEIGDSPYYGFHFFLRPALLIKDAVLVNDILVKDFNHFEDHGFYTNPNEVNSKDVFFANGPQWKKSRAVMSPKFTSSKIKPIVEFVARSTDGVEKAIEADDGVVEIFDLMLRHSINTGVGFMFGANTDAFQKDSVYKRVTLSLFKNLEFAFIVGMVSPWLYDSLKLRTYDKTSMKFIRELTEKLISHRLTSGEKKQDFLQSMIELLEKGRDEDDRNGVSDIDLTEILMHTTQAYGASLESPGLAMSLTMLEIAFNQHCQEEVRREVSRITSNVDELTYEQISELSYTTMCVSETLRKYPLVTTIFRECTKNYVVPKTGLTIEKGTLIFLPILGLQRDPKYYPDPGEFRPERFASQREPGTYLPFGNGPRICIGQKFVMTEAVYTVARLVAKYRVTVDGRTKLPFDVDLSRFLLTPKEPLWLRFDPINRD